MTRPHPEMRRGFTLVEVMVALFAGTVIMILVLGAYTSLSTSLSNTESHRNLNGSMRHAMDMMQRDIAKGSEVTQCSIGSRLALTTAATGSSSNTATVVYRLNNNSLSRKEGSGPAEALAESVKAITFTLYDVNGAVTSDPGSAYFVDVELEGETQIVLNRYSDTLQTRTRLRAKGL